MKRNSFLVAALVFLWVSLSFAQFKGSANLKPSVSESIIRPDGGGWLFGLIDPNKLSMHHSFSLSYSSFGQRGLSMGVYTNSLLYRFSSDLDFQADVSLMHSPYNTFGQQFQKDFSGVFLSRAELNYRPSNNMLFSLQYRQLPPMYWLGNGFYRPSFFDGIDRYQGDNR
jgi:hypothetical protein